MIEEPNQPMREPHINPRPRTRVQPIPTSSSPAAHAVPQPASEALTPESAKASISLPAKPPRVRKPRDEASSSAAAKAIRAAEIAAKPYDTGYGKPPPDTQFKKGGPPGPGRPPGRKSQDTLRREALETKRVVRVGGRSRKLANREVMNMMVVNEAIDKRDTKQMAAILADARRLYPDVVQATDRAEAYDPAADRAALAEFMTLLSIGEPNPDVSDAFADLAFEEPNLGEPADGDGWDEGDWNAAPDRNNAGA